MPQRPSEVVREFPEWLRLTGGSRVVLVLDALNQLESRDRAHDLGWLPTTCPENVRVVVSSLPGVCLDELRRRAWQTYDVRPLDSAECARLCVAYLQQFAKALERSQIERVVAAPQTANPLFLRTLLDELRMFGSFERLERQISYYLKARNAEELFDRVLVRCESDCDAERPGLVRDALRLVWAARRGLAEAELLELLGKPGEPLPRVYWSNLALTIDSALVSRSGLLDFSHDYFRHAVERRYLSRPRQKRAAHLRLSSYFEHREFGQAVTRRRWGGPYWIWLAAFLPLAGGLAWGTWELMRFALVPPTELGGFIPQNLPALLLLLAVAAAVALVAAWSLVLALSGLQWCWRRLGFKARGQQGALEVSDAASNARAREELPWQLVRAAEWWRLHDLLARPDFLRRAGTRSLPEVADFWLRAQSGTAGGLARWWARTPELQRVHRDLFGGRPVDAYRCVLDTLAGDPDHTTTVAAVLLECGYARESLVLSDRLVASQGRNADVSLLAGALFHLSHGLVHEGLFVGALSVLRNLESLLRGSENPSLLARCLYAQAAILQSWNDRSTSLARLDEADQLNPGPATELYRLRGQAVRASCYAADGAIDRALELFRETEVLLLDGGGGPTDLLWILGRQFKVLTDTGRSGEAAAAELRIRRLCAESDITDPAPYLAAPPPHRQFAKLKAAALEWKSQRRLKFSTFALVEASRTLAIDAGFPLGAQPLLMEAEKLATRQRDGTLDRELIDLRKLVDEAAVRQRQESIELARPARVQPLMETLVFLSAFALIAFFQFKLMVFSSVTGIVGLLVNGLLAWVCLAAALRRLHGIFYLPPSIQAFSCGLLVRGWGLGEGGSRLDLYRFLRPYRRVEVRTVLWEALLGIERSRAFLRYRCTLNLESEKIDLRIHFHSRTRKLSEAINSEQRKWLQAKAGNPQGLTPAPKIKRGKRAFLPDFGSLAFMMAASGGIIGNAMNEASKGASSSGPGTASQSSTLVFVLGCTASILGLLALLGFGRRMGVLRKSMAAVALLSGFGFIFSFAFLGSLRLVQVPRSLAELDQIVAWYPTESKAWVKRGQARIDAGDNDGGIADLTEAIQIQPDSPGILKRRGIALAAKGEPARAVTDYTAAISLNAKDAELHNYRGVAFLTMGKTDEALRDFNTAAFLDPKLAIARFNCGFVRLERGEIDAAIADLNEAVRLDPKSDNALVRRGIAWRWKKDFPRAITDFTAALEIDSNKASTYNYRGAAQTGKGDLKAALVDFDRSIELDPKLRQAFDNRGDTRFVLKDSAGAIADFGECIRLAPNNPDGYRKRGAVLSDGKRYQEAMADFAEALRLDSKNAAIFNLRGVAYLGLKNPKAALGDFDRSIKLDSSQRQVFDNRGEVRFALNDSAGAIVDFAECIRLAPKDPTGYRKRGNLFSLGTRYQEAVADFTEALRLDSKNAAVFNLRGVAYHGLKNRKAALADYDRSIQLDPNQRHVFDNRGELRFALNDSAGAIADFAECIRLAPKDPEGFRKRGAILSHAKRYQEAVADFTEALKLDSKNAALFNLRGVANRGLNKLKEGLADFDRSIQLDPNQRQVFENRGDTRLAAKDLAGAIADFGECIRLAPKDPAGYRQRGAVRNQGKHYQEALVDFTEALRLDPKNAAVFNLRGVAHHGLKNYKAALADYDRSIGFDPNQRQVFDNRGEARAAIKDFIGAAADFGQCIRLAPNGVQGYLDRANCLAQTGKHQEAVADYTEAIRRGKADAPTFNRRGVVFLNSGDKERGIADFAEAIRLDPRYSLAYLNRGIAHLRKQELEPSLADFDEYVKLEPRQLRGYRERGAVRLRLSKWQQAADDFATIVKLEPRSYADGIVLACLRLKLNDRTAYDKAGADLLRTHSSSDDPTVSEYAAHYLALVPGAEPQLKQAIALARKNLQRVKIDRVGYLRWLGAALFRAGEYMDAIQTLEAAVAAQKNEGEPVDWLFMAMAHHQSGDLPEAKRWFEKASKRLEIKKDAKPQFESPADWVAQYQQEILLKEASALLAQKP